MTIKIPGYRIERLLAEGGMATVYLATQESLGRYVALKLLRKFENANQSKRFLHEGQILAALNHPNIITIYNIGVTDDEQPYISMEYLEGGDLEARIEIGIDPEEALQIVETMGDCLHFVHQKGIVHRDIKPANILFHNNDIPVLSDFGIAKQEDRDTRLTMDGSALGSPYYLSPEQAECKALDGRADIYGLGIVFYEMLTGKKPYKGNSHIETIAAHLFDSLPVLPPELSQYQDLVNKMIAKSADDRFSNAGEMVQYIQALREDKSNSQTSVLDKKFATSHGGPRAINHTQQQLTIWSKIKLTISQDIRANKTSILSAALAVLLTFTGTYLWLQKQSSPVSIEQSIAKDTQSDEGEVHIDKADKKDASEISILQQSIADLFSSGLPITAYQKSQRINEYMEKADLALKEYRLILPKNKNAYYYYQQILDIQADHEGATEGMSKIANAYADLAESELNKFNYPGATRYVNMGLRIEPDNSRLLQLEKSTNALLDAPKRAINKIKAIFR